ncbi:MAG TPA: hypothetical protein VIA98_11075 [Allosphingosinicella sp.]|jgi:hypothetical protein
MGREGERRKSANPVRDLFDACAHGYSVRLTCRGCRRARIFPAAAIWHHFRRKGFDDGLRQVPGRFRCRVCDRSGPALELVHEAPNDRSLPMPSQSEWKRELRRRR